jgi:two-component system OmpR family sensor kinase
MKRWQWVVVLLPAALGLAVAAFLVGERLAKQAFYLRIEPDPLVVLVGFILSTAAALALAVRGRLQRARHKALVESMAKASEARHRFMRRLDHELKNPLTAIHAGLANLALATDPDEQRKILAGVEAQIVHLSRLVTNLRKLADLEVRPLERSPVNVTELLEAVFAVVQEQPAAAARHLALALPQKSPPLPAVPGDRDLLSLAVYNLLDNALKFTRPGDKIELRAFKGEGAVVVEVADTGPGVPEVDMPHVWEELYRGRGARGMPGSGIGLALVHAVVERHGGQVGLRSQVGGGAVFAIRLPVA